MNRATENWPHAPAPDFGGLHGRFADLYARREPSRWHHTAAIVAGAVAGVAMAWGVVL